MAIDTGSRNPRQRRIGPTHTNTSAPVTPAASTYQRTLPTTNRVVTPTKLPGLNRKQSNVARTVLKTGKKRDASLMELLAAAETGLVESHFTNLGGGDADSAGWRQERASLYPDPTNVVHSATRFYDELGHVPGSTAGELAANVQRPLAAYRPRYQDLKPQARKILSAFLHGG